jgi:hypothetical protein
MTPILRRLTNTGVRKGMAGSSVWFVVGVLAGGVRLLKWVARRNDEVLYRTVVKPGEKFEIVAKRPPQ